MNLLKSAAFSILLLSLGGAAHADSKTDRAPAKAVKTAPTVKAYAQAKPEVAPGELKKAAAMSVRHKTRSSAARAKLRGDPTAGLGRKGVLGEQLQKRSDRSESLSVFLDEQRLSLRPKKKPSKAKKRHAPAERFEPGPLDFMNE
jgi:hypothetical protein